MSSQLEKVWAQKYRPLTLDEIIMDETLRSDLQPMVDKGPMHSLFTGPPGTGKTTIAKAIARAIGADMIFLNGSLNRGIDVVRNKIVNFCSTLSLDGNQKIVFFDEADKLTPDAQLALRGVIEEFSSNVIFFMTANYPDKLDEAIRSRFETFRVEPKDQKVTMQKMAHRCVEILTAENVDFDKKAIVNIVKAKYPDFRSIINSLERFGKKGRIDESVVDQIRSTTTDTFFRMLKEKKYKDMVTWILENVPDPSGFVLELWEVSDKKFTPKSLPIVAVHLDDCQDRLTRVPDRHLTVIATMTKIMADAEVL